jgi:hypothetical protein
MSTWGVAYLNVPESHRSTTPPTTLGRGNVTGVPTTPACGSSAPSTRWLSKPLPLPRPVPCGGAGRFPPCPWFAQTIAFPTPRPASSTRRSACSWKTATPPRPCACHHRRGGGSGGAGQLSLRLQAGADGGGVRPRPGQPRRQPGGLSRQSSKRTPDGQADCRGCAGGCLPVVGPAPHAQGHHSPAKSSSSSSGGLSTSRGRAPKPSSPTSTGRRWIVTARPSCARCPTSARMTWCGACISSSASSPTRWPERM